jgi:hypothetical protein
LPLDSCFIAAADLAFIAVADLARKIRRYIRHYNKAAKRSTGAVEIGTSLELSKSGTSNE